MGAGGAGQVDAQPLKLSEDALIVQTLTADLQRAGVSGDVLPIVQRHGYLQDWDKDRWERAERELAQARLLQARQRYQARDMTSMQEVMEASLYDDEPLDDS